MDNYCDYLSSTCLFQRDKMSLWELFLLLRCVCVCLFVCVWSPELVCHSVLNITTKSISTWNKSMCVSVCYTDALPRGHSGSRYLRVPCTLFKTQSSLPFTSPPAAESWAVAPPSSDLKLHTLVALHLWTRSVGTEQFIPVFPLFFEPTPITSLYGVYLHWSEGGGGE